MSALPVSAKADLGAQIAACHTGAERLREVCGRYGLQRAQSASRALLDYSERMMRAFLARVPQGTYRAEDFMDSDGISDRPVKIAVAVKVERAAGESPAATWSPWISPARIRRSREASMRSRRLRIRLVSTCFDAF